MDGNSFAFLDDIYISNSICSATVICNDGGFRCLLSKECINGTMFCDRKRDCSEGSDEHNCNYNSKNSIVFGSSEYPQSPSCGINANKTNSKLKNSSNDHPAMQIKSLDKDKIQNDAKNIKNDARCAIFSSVCTCIISDPSLRFKSLSWKECSSIKAVFYLFFELQNLTCLEVSLPNNQLFSIYYFNIVDSNISTIEIMKKKMTTLQHITIRDSIVENLTITQGNNASEQLQTLQLINCTIKRIIDFSSNVIPFIKEGDFNESTSLQILKLQGNLIEYISGNTFKDMISLYLLDLSSNLITKIRKNYFIALKNLNYLYLNYNRINDIDAMAFSNLISLYTLDLSYNDITHFEAGLFLALEYLEYLYIHKNRIKAVDGMFWGLFDLKVLKVDAFSICCAKPRSRNDVHCVAPINEIASCEHLINAPVLNVGIWYIAFLATVGNMIAMICSISTFRTSSFAYFIFSRNLSVADFLMGIYLFIIAITNLIGW
ncbi:relaxin receptor 2-like [Saccostrea cucullata]|uniref:relaxin receptor 2-like n=1 Tax=Saccostrea cuccullata TaxID=36930 RepID=UPI002ED00126